MQALHLFTQMDAVDDNVLRLSGLHGCVICPGDMHESFRFTNREDVIAYWCQTGDGETLVPEPEVPGHRVQRGNGHPEPCDALWHCQHAGDRHRPGPHQQSLQVSRFCEALLMLFVCSLSKSLQTKEG